MLLMLGIEKYAFGSSRYEVKIKKAKTPIKNNQSNASNPSTSYRAKFSNLWKKPRQEKISAKDQKAVDILDNLEIPDNAQTHAEFLSINQQNNFLKNNTAQQMKILNTKDSIQQQKLLDATPVPEQSSRWSFFRPKLSKNNLPKTHSTNVSKTPSIKTEDTASISTDNDSIDLSQFSNKNNSPSSPSWMNGITKKFKNISNDISSGVANAKSAIHEKTTPVKAKPTRVEIKHDPVKLSVEDITKMDKERKIYKDAQTKAQKEAQDLGNKFDFMAFHKEYNAKRYGPKRFKGKVKESKEDRENSTKTLWNS